MSVDLETAKKLKEMGMAQGQSHQRWYWYVGEAAELLCVTADIERGWDDWCDAPEWLEAVDFIESLGYVWERGYFGGLDEAEWKVYTPAPTYPTTLVEASPAALIAAVYEHWRSNRPPAGVAEKQEEKP